MNKNLTWSANKRNEVITKIKFTTAKLFAKVETATQHYLDYIAGHNAYDCDLTEIETLKNDITRAIKVMSDYCQPETYKPLSTLSKISPYLDMLEEQGLTDTDMLDDLFEHHELTLGNIERYLIAQTEELEHTLARYNLPENLKNRIKTELEINYGLLDQLTKWNTDNNDSDDFGNNFQEEYYYNELNNIDEIIEDIPPVIRPDEYNSELMYPDEKDDYYAAL